MGCAGYLGIILLGVIIAIIAGGVLREIGPDVVKSGDTGTVKVTVLNLS